jgi:hypothetical protein
MFPFSTNIALVALMEAVAVVASLVTAMLHAG